jgi:hypothetical protein
MNCLGPAGCTLHELFQDDFFVKSLTDGAGHGLEGKIRSLVSPHNPGFTVVMGVIVDGESTTSP